LESYLKEQLIITEEDHKILEILSKEKVIYEKENLKKIE
jgi:hypothetical protein